MRTNRSTILTKPCILLVGLLLIAYCPNILYAAGSEYPNRPISLIVPFAAGGVTDLNARVFAEAMEKHLKQPVVVVNKPGGAMTIGGYAVASAKPDGYTLGFLVGSSVVPEAFTYFYAADYSSNDLRPICRVCTLVLTIIVRADAPWSSLKELIEFLRKNPGSKFAHNGQSVVQYIVMTSIAKEEKLNIVGVPFKGDSDQIPALLGGHIPIGTPGFASILSLVSANKVRVLAVLNEKRVDFAPDVPTVVELGYKLPFEAFTGIFGPKGTPDGVVKKINEVARKISEDEDYQKKIKELIVQVTYEDTAPFEKSLVRLKENLQTFFKEEGLVKK